MLQKHYQWQVFDQDGIAFLKSFSKQLVKNSPSFSSRINGVYGECVMDLNITLNEFLESYEGSSVNFMNIVKIYAVDEDNPRGRLIYTGYMSRITPYLESGEQGVRISLLGLGTLLSYAYYSVGTTSQSSKDSETIGRLIIDHFNSIYGGSLLSYSDDTTDPVGTNVSIDFTDQKWVDALKKTAELAGTDWWWKIDESGLYWLKAKPSTPTHSFTIGRHIDRLSMPKDSEDVINDVVVRWESGTATDSDSTSQATYGTGSPATGKRTELVTATELTTSGTADQRVAKILEDKKDARFRGASLKINSQYDLESIKVGETCRLLNHYESTFFSTNMLITSIQYSMDAVTLNLEDLSDFGTELQSLIDG